MISSNSFWSSTFPFPFIWDFNVTFLITISEVHELFFMVVSTLLFSAICLGEFFDSDSSHSLLTILPQSSSTELCFKFWFIGLLNSRVFILFSFVSRHSLLKFSFFIYLLIYTSFTSNTEILRLLKKGCFKIFVSPQSWCVHIPFYFPCGEFRMSNL